jgi:peptide methionine sulfoxide reductase MsrA
MQNNLQDSLGLLTVAAQLVTDYGNDVGEARRLLDSFFEVEKPPMTAAQLQAIGSKYSRSQRRIFVANCSYKCTSQQRTVVLRTGFKTVELLTMVKRPGHRIYFVITIGFKNIP